MSHGERWRLRRVGVDANAKVRVGRLASRQSGRVGAYQLRRLEVSRDCVAEWTRAGYLYDVLPNVYGVGHVAPSVEADLTAALLYAGPDAALSHTSAIWWYGILKDPPPAIQVSTPHRRQSIDGIDVHARRSAERVWHNRLPVTTAAQALLDYAATAPLSDLRYALAEAEYRKLLDLTAIDLTAGRGRPGSAKLRTAIERHEPKLAQTNSRLERQFIEMCEAQGLPYRRVANGSGG